MKTLSIPIKKIFLFILLCAISIFTSLILSACTYIAIIDDIVSSGYQINRIIYTNTPEKYLQNATIVDLSNISSYRTDELYLISSNESGMYDIVIDELATTMFPTNSVDYCSLSLNYHMAGATNMCLFPVAPFDVSYMFSGNMMVNYFNGYLSCGDDRCICNHDYFDRVCYHVACGDSITVDSYLSESEIRKQLNIPCSCYSYTTTENEDGTYTYEAYESSMCQGQNGNLQFISDGTFFKTYLSTFPYPTTVGFQTAVTGNSGAQFTFKELVIDGFNLGDTISMIEGRLSPLSFDIDSCVDTWRENMDTSSWTHMFSDLPVEKITIKNVTGLSNYAKDISSMFENCINLKSVEFGNLFEGLKPTNISRMFYNCPQLESVDLSSLDTSEVTDMSEMFALKTSSSITAEQRKTTTEQYLNQVISSGMVPELEVFNNGTTYTIESFSQSTGLSAEMIYYLAVTEFGLDIPLTFNEYCLGEYGETFGQVLVNALDNPTRYNLTENADDYETIAFYIKACALSKNIDIILGAQLYTGNNSRDDFINHFINNVGVEMTPGYVDKTQTYTLSTYAEAINYDKFRLLIEIVHGVGVVCNISIPITCDEACMYALDMSFDEAVELLKDNLPSGMDAEQYLLDILKNNGLGFFVVRDANDIENYYNNSYSARGTLILGGDNSKFIIPNNTNVSNMFGKGCDFKSIVMPNIIGDNFEIMLNNSYTDGNNIINSINATTAGIEVELYENQPLPSSPVMARRPILKVLIIALCVCGGITLLVVIPIVRANIKKRKSFQRSIWMSTRQ